MVTQTCALAVTDSSGMTVDLRYAGPPGNQPRANANFLALWNSSIVVWATPPLARDTIASDSEAGTQVLNNVSIGREPYTLSYAVGPDVSDICASAQLNADGSAGPTDSVTARITAIGTTSLTVHFHALSGYLPAKSGNWVGLWAGRVSPFHAPTPLTTMLIPADVTDGDLGLNGVTIARGGFYTLVYFMGPANTTAAAVLTFQAPE